MKFGQFGETFPPTLDGVGQVMYAYCRELNKLGHEAVYVAPKNNRIASDLECRTMLYASVPLPKHIYRFGFPMLEPAFMKKLYREKFDLVHAHAPVLAGRAARMVARRQNIPLISTFHSKYYDDLYRATHSEVLSKQLLGRVLAFYRSCDEVWAVSGTSADVLRGYGYKGEIVVMPNGISPEEIGTADPGALKKYPIPESGPMLLFVGQQDFKKNTRTLIEACALLRAKGQPFRLFMVGEGQDREALTELAAERGIADAVVFTGAIFDRSEIMALYQRADLFVFPSVYDNAPMVVREAAIAGTPSLVVGGSCAAENIEDGVNGFTCEDSPESVANRIIAALPACPAVGAEAKRTIPIPWSDIVRQVADRYALVCDRKRAQRG